MPDKDSKQFIDNYTKRVLARKALHDIARYIKAMDASHQRDVRISNFVITLLLAIVIGMTVYFFVA
jgi:hypothetical protein